MLRFPKSTLPTSRAILLPILLLMAACAAPPGTDDLADLTGATGVGGQVLQDGRPADGAFVYAYRSASRGLRGPADFGARVEPDGSYFLDLVEGEYHLVARLRKSGSDAGPPRPGDAWAIYPDNPVRVAPQSIVSIDFRLRESGTPRQGKQGTLTSGDTGFRGRLIAADGHPFPDALVLAYRTPEFHRMPDLTSPPSDRDGQFTLFVPEPGTYCLAARTGSRGQPRAGEPYGTLGEGDEACRRAVAGQLLDVGTIVLAPYR
ncbi:MAG: hypothetical protein C0615_09950 [Desulfuromonas sp.]|nr:MAG: hypothetical protein C0615_09950 [Desulfuromonas sp.]